MSALGDWWESRTGMGGWLGRCRERRVGGRACLRRSMPCLVLFAFAVQIITGIFLLMHYCPSSQTAWESVYYLQYQVQGGWLLRAVHHCCGQAVLVLVGLWLLGLIVRGAYRAPREFVYWSVLLLALTTLAMLLTGDLLAWDDNSRSATLTRVGFLQALPGVGEPLFRLAAGGAEFGNLTLAHFTALHVVVFAGAFGLFLVLRWWFVRRASEPIRDPKGAPYWPNQTLVNVVGCLALLAVIFACALAGGVDGPERGVALGPPADPTGFYDAARPEWAFLGLYGFSKLDVFAGSTIVPIFIIPGALVLLFLLMPFVGLIRLGRFKLGHAMNVVVVLVLAAGDLWLSLDVLAHDRADEAHQRAIRQNAEAARRVAVLIAHRGGIPPTGALDLLQNDPKTQGPLLFQRHCASCHNHVGGTPDDIQAEESSAPNLFAYGSRRWLAGLLDPERVGGPDYFGDTAFRRGQMVDFVRETFVDMDEEYREERDQIVAGLSAEAVLPDQATIDGRDAKQIAKGRELIGEYCTDCHQFGDQGKLGTAPKLTGWASREWMIGIISNPADRRFYGKKNDRMQAYAETDDEAKNLLTNREIELLVDWLRSDWYDSK